MIGIGPVWAVVPFIMLGNAAYVCVWRLIGGLNFSNAHVVRIIALAGAAITKFLVLYISLVKIALPYFLNLNEQQTARMIALFSLPQLITASIGGAVAVVVLPVIEKARAARR